MLSPVSEEARLHAPRQPHWQRAWFLWTAGFGSLFAAVYLFSLLFRLAMSEAAHRYSLSVSGVGIPNSHYKETAEALGAALCVALGMIFPGFLARPLGWIEGIFTHFAAHRTQAILFAGVFPMVVRLALIPLIPIPQPRIHDEFGYLLVADTLASGRLANPPHPLWKSFESIYVLHQPTYASQYPVAPAIPLAVAIILGVNPWFGVWLGAGLMCSLICWMLQAWTRPKWALLGALIAASRFAIVSPWMNTFWGGATAVTGGALVVGALPRIMKHCRVRDTLLLGLGLFVLAQSRPLEGALLSIPLLLWLAIWLVRERRIRGRIRLARVALPLAAAIITLAGFTAFHNWRVTGNPLLMPYALNRKIYGTPQTFFWQRPIMDAPGIHGPKDIRDVFQWQLAAHNSGFSWAMEAGRLEEIWRFFLQPLLTLPLLFLPLILKRSGFRVLMAGCILLLAGNSQYPFFFPHYAGPICGVLVLFVVQGIRYLHAFKLGSRRSGALASRSLIILIAASSALAVVRNAADAGRISAGVTPRSHLTAELTQRGGKHLVFVRYGPDHVFHYDVSYNAANIDKARIVWARELDAASNQRLIAYYPGREVWLFDPDQGEYGTLMPFTDRAYINLITGSAAGTRDDALDGVAPGSLALIFAGNLAPKLHGSTNTKLLGSLPVRVAEITPAHRILFAPLELPQHPGEVPAGVSVRFGDADAKVLAISNFAGQESVTVEVPPGIRAGQISVVLQEGANSARKAVQVRPALPGIFQMRMSDDSPRAILLRGDGSLVDLEHPAHRGEVLRAFVTGLGQFLRDRSAIRVGVNNRPVPVISATAAEAIPGVDEVAFAVPADARIGRDIAFWISVRADGNLVYSNRTGLPVK